LRCHPSHTTVVADQPARETHRDRREGRQPRPLHHVPNAEVAVSRQMFADMLSLIARLRAPTRARTRGQRHQMRQAPAAEVRFDAVGAARFSAAAWSTGGFECLLRATSAVAHCSSRSKGRFWRRTRPGNLANVALISHRGGTTPTQAPIGKGDLNGNRAYRDYRERKSHLR